ncbi:hypothetical protein D3C72_2601490 [compost metagenome]
MDELAVDPQRGAGIGKVGAFEKAFADRRAGDALVEAGERDSGVGEWPQQALDGQVGEIVRH